MNIWMDIKWIDEFLGWMKIWMDFRWEDEFLGWMNIWMDIKGVDEFLGWMKIWMDIKGVDECALTCKGCSWGASNLSLFLQRSMSVKRPVRPVACASAYTISWNRQQLIDNFKSINHKQVTSCVGQILEDFEQHL